MVVGTPQISSGMSQRQEGYRQQDEALDADGVFAKRMMMAGITTRDRIGIAVSGGPDSMALCILAVRWWQREGPVMGDESGVVTNKLTGMVVDHGLRPESAMEALCVQRRVSSLGMECLVLSCEWVEGIPAPSHLQEAARNARYTLMERACRRHAIDILLTAHHADDQAELFVMRLARGSGIAGLAGMAFVSYIFPRMPIPCIPCRVHQGLLLVRPLLDLSKDDLYQVCRDAGQEWVEDPTNRNRLFARNRIRMSLAEPQFRLRRKEIQDLINSCRKTRAALDGVRDKVLAVVVSVSHDLAYATIDVERLSSSCTTDAVLSRVLVAVLQFVAQKEKPPRGRGLKFLMERIRQSPFQGAFTLGGCTVAPVSGSKGSKLLVCFSPDSPVPSVCVETSLWKAYSMGPPSRAVWRTAWEPGTAMPQVVNMSPERSIQAHLLEPSIPILDAEEGSASVLEQGKQLGLISESSMDLLHSLSMEVADAMTKTCKEGTDIEREIRRGIPTAKGLNWPLAFGESCYFMNRFVVSWSPNVAGASSSELFGLQGLAKENLTYNYSLLQSNNSGHTCNSGGQAAQCCLLTEKPHAWIRHFEEKDWTYLSQVARVNYFSNRCEYAFSNCLDQTGHPHGGSGHETMPQDLLWRSNRSVCGKSQMNLKSGNRVASAKEIAGKDVVCGSHLAAKAQQASAILGRLPQHVRRGLPVLVNAQGLLLGIPSIGFQCCPWVLMSANLCPRLPLGGGHASWL